MAAASVCGSQLMAHGDESGDMGFGPGGTQHLTVAFILSPRPQTVNRIVRNVKRALKIPRNIELKIPNDKLPTDQYLEARRRVFKGLGTMSCRVHAITAKKAKVVGKLRDAGTNNLYNHMTGLLLPDIFATLPTGYRVVVVPDNRSFSVEKSVTLGDYLRAKVLVEKGRPDIRLDCFPCDSRADLALQAAHLAANAIFRYHERGDGNGTAQLGEVLVDDRKLFF